MLGCIDSNVEINTASLEEARDELRDVVASIRSLALILTIVCCMVAFTYFLCIVAIFLIVLKHVVGGCCGRDFALNCHELPKESKVFFCTMYNKFN